MDDDEFLMSLLTTSDDQAKMNLRLGSKISEAEQPEAVSSRLGESCHRLGKVKQHSPERTLSVFTQLVE